MSDQVDDAVNKTAEEADEAKQAADSAKEQVNGNGATDTLRQQAVGAFSSAAKDILGPAIQQLSKSAAEQAANYAKEQGPKIVKEQVLPQVMKSAGVDNPQDLAKAGIGKAGEAISDAGGVTGIAGKLMSKIGPKGSGGQATGYGKGRRMPIQQDLYVALPVEDTYRCWTEYSRWSEYMHRANGVDPDIDDETAKLRVTEKLWLFTRPFTAEVVEQRPNEVIRWKSVEGINHVGVITFHDIAERLTLISLNIDISPKGPFEKIGRGTRFAKRAIRADLHRFKGWVEHQDSEQLEDIEGWLGTVEDGQITESHDDALGGENGGQEGEGPESAGDEDEVGEGEGQDQQDDGEGVEEVEEGGEEGGEEDLEEDQELDEEPEADEDEDEDEEPEADADEDEEPEPEPEEEPEAEEEPPMPKPRKRGGGQRRRSTESKPKPKPKRSPARSKSS